MKDLAGKCAFVTGGASGVGLGMAEAFIGAGMKVVIADIEAPTLAEAAANWKRRAAKCMPSNWTFRTAPPWKAPPRKPKTPLARSI